MDRFSKLNPKVSFLFFIFAIILSLVLFNPYYLAISFLASAIYSIALQGKRAIKTIFSFIIPFVIAVGFFNMIFVDKGVTVLFTLFNREFTLEALFYGICQGIMFSSVIMWISCYSIVVSSDKFLSLFSNFAPNLSLVLSMSLSFIPRLRRNANEINDARFNIEEKSKIKKAGDSFSSLVSITLEESIEVAQSMRARGFNGNRKAYSKYTFSIADGIYLAVIILLSALCISLKIMGKALFIFEPAIEAGKPNVALLVGYSVLSFLPIIIDLWEDIKWLYLKQKA